MEAIILCGGIVGKVIVDERLQFAPTLPIGNTPLLAHTLDTVARAGVCGCTVSLFEGADRGEEIVRTRRSDALQTRIALERQGTGSAGALLAMRGRANEPFVAIMGDTFIERIDVEALLGVMRAAHATAMLLVRAPSHENYDYGAVFADPDGQLVALGNTYASEPRARANCGIYFFDPAVFDYLPSSRAASIEGDLLPTLLAAGCTVLVVEAGAYCRRVDSLSAFWQVNSDLLSGIAGPVPATSAAAWIDPTAELRGAVLLGKGCRIGRDAVIIGPTVLGANVTVGRGVLLEQALVLDNTRIGIGAAFHCSVICGIHAISTNDGNVTTFTNPAILLAHEHRRWRERCEQALHSALALLLLALLLPVLLLVALAIRLESPGPVLYSQLRIGQRRRGVETGAYPGGVFAFYKFRSMHNDADKRLALLAVENEYHSDTFIKLKHDPRITRVGRFIRKTSIDELPQLLNVIKGDMRLVGNRPLPLYEAARFNEAWQQVRFRAPAGMTGLWQIHGRSDLSLEERIILDNYYAVSRSFWTDMRILFLTIPAVILQRGSH